MLLLLVASHVGKAAGDCRCTRYGKVFLLNSRMCRENGPLTCCLRLLEVVTYCHYKQILQQNPSGCPPLSKLPNRSLTGHVSLFTGGVALRTPPRRRAAADAGPGAFGPRFRLTLAGEGVAMKNAKDELKEARTAPGRALTWRVSSLLGVFLLRGFLFSDPNR